MRDGLLLGSDSSYLSSLFLSHGLIELVFSSPRSNPRPHVWLTWVLTYRHKSKESKDTASISISIVLRQIEGIVIHIEHVRRS
jgi:hypothetical protein